jgi:hypothetical protein
MEYKHIELTPEERRMVAGIRAARSPRDVSAGSIKDLLAQYPKQPITLAFLGTRFDECMNAIAKVVGERFRRLETENNALRARVTELEANKSNRVTGVSWAGPHQSGATYRSGELVQKNGLWLCITKETTAAPGTAPADWRLVVHRKLVPKTDDEE